MGYAGWHAGCKVRAPSEERRELRLKQELYFVVYSFAVAVLLYAAQFWMKLV